MGQVIQFASYRRNPCAPQYYPALIWFGFIPVWTFIRFPH